MTTRRYHGVDNEWIESTIVRKSYASLEYRRLQKEHGWVVCYERVLK